VPASIAASAVAVSVDVRFMWFLHYQLLALKSARGAGAHAQSSGRNHAPH
jgi:hypothetical protein